MPTDKGDLLGEKHKANVAFSVIYLTKQLMDDIVYCGKSKYIRRSWYCPLYQKCCCIKWLHESFLHAKKSIYLQTNCLSIFWCKHLKPTVARVICICPDRILGLLEIVEIYIHLKPNVKPTVVRVICISPDRIWGSWRFLLTLNIQLLDKLAVV